MQTTTNVKKNLNKFGGGGVCDAFFRDLLMNKKNSEQCLFKIENFSNNISLFYYFLLI